MRVPFYGTKMYKVAKKQQKNNNPPLPPYNVNFMSINTGVS